jgi:hypothetical protein
MSGGAVSGNTSSSSGGGVYVGGGPFTMSGGAVSGNTSSFSGGGVGVYNGTFTMSGGEVRDNILSGTNPYGREVVLGGGTGGTGTFKMSGDARPQRVFLFNNTRYITISGPLSGGTLPIDLGITPDNPLTSWLSRPVLALDSSYDAGNLAALKTRFTLGNAKMTEPPWTETPIPAEYTIGDDGKLLVLSSGISGITYSAVSGDPWTPEADGRYQSPATANSTTTKERVTFTAETGANITVQLEVSSESGYDYAFISTLDNGSATYSSGYFTGSRISGTTSVTVSIPVPTAGSHFIDICYRKDSSGTGGSDCAWFTVVE